MTRSFPPRSALRDFLESESAGGMLLIFAAILAMIVANSAFAETYEHAIHAVTGPTLTDQLPPEVWTDLSTALANRGIPAFMAAKFRPWYISVMLGMPPLLRTYLLMGGWVSDHAVVDRDLNTLHVFTALEIRAIPPARARLLRGVAG